MLHSGLNLVEGIPIEVVRKRVRRLSLRVEPDGRIRLTLPIGWATLARGEAFLREKWRWVCRTRQKALEHPVPKAEPVTAEDLAALKVTLAELQDLWTARLGECDVSWKLRAMKTLWGSCHFRKRKITYNAELARVPRELVEYVVVHELTHLVVHNHGPAFYRLMDERLPGWQVLRRKLNRRDFQPNGARN